MPRGGARVGRPLSAGGAGGWTGGPTDGFPGKEREVRWRPANVLRDGALALDGLLRPDSDAVAYALTYVRSERRSGRCCGWAAPGR